MTHTNKSNWKIQGTEKNILTFDQVGSCAEFCGHDIAKNINLCKEAENMLAALIKAATFIQSQYDGKPTCEAYDAVILAIAAAQGE